MRSCEVRFSMVRFINEKRLNNALGKIGLCNLGAFRIDDEERYLSGFSTLVLVGPDEPNFWKIFKCSYEFLNIKDDPLDVWSQRNISSIAEKFNAKPFFPFQNNPFLPFYSWALRSGETFVSPIKLLVHSKRGLFVSFRGALAFKQHLPDSRNRILNYSPCTSCSAPCVTACPAGALTKEKYDVEKCKDFVNRHSEINCKQGCLVRRVCPVGKSRRFKEQAEFHMNAFLV